MSFLSRFRGNSDKQKTPKSDWEPPKIPSATVVEEHVQSPNITLGDTQKFGGAEDTKQQAGSSEAQGVLSSSSFDFLGNDNGSKVVGSSSESSFSFLNQKESNSIIAEHDAVSDTSSNMSKFSFISDEHSSLSEPTLAVPQNVAKKIAPRKKKKKAVTPGYGIGQDPSKSDVVRQLRSSSNASETKSEGSSDLEIKCVEDTDNGEESSPRETNKDVRKESLSNREGGSVFGFIADDHASEELKGSNTETEEKLRTTEYSVGECSAFVDGANEKRINDSTQKAEDMVADNGKENDGHCLPLTGNGEFEVCEAEQIAEDLINTDYSAGRSDITKGTDESEGAISGSRVGMRHESLQELEDVLENNGNESSSVPVSYDLQLDEEEKFEVYLETLKSRETALRNELGMMRQNRDEIIEELRGKRFCKDFLVSQLKDLYTEQNVAISNEDFAVADKINQEIERKQTELDNLKFKHPIIDNKVIQFVEQCNGVLLKHLQECNDLEEEFRRIIETEEGNLESKVTKNDNILYKAKLKLDEERTRLDREMGHISLDKEHFQKSKVKLEAEIEERIKDQQTEKSKLLAEKQTVKAEIEELEAKLSVLRDTENSLNLKINGVDLKIQEMTVDFLPQKDTLEREQKEISIKEDELISRLKLLEEDEAELKEKKEKEEELEQKYLENIAMLATKIASLQTFRTEMDLNVIDVKEIIDVSILNFVPSHEQSRLKEKMNDLSDQLSSEKYQHTDCNAQIARLKKRLCDIEARVEELEKEKQIAVSSRNFKAAKVVTEERKKIMEEGEKSQEAVEVLEAKQRQLKLSIDALDDEISRSKEKIFEIETEMDEKISSSLMDAIVLLTDNHNKSTLNSWIGPFFTFEIQICRDIVKSIHSKHNWELPESFNGDDVITEARNKDSLLAAVTCPKGIGTSVIEGEIEELESQLQAAIENEDFDTAEEINIKIEEYEGKHV